MKKDIYFHTVHPDFEKLHIDSGFMPKRPKTEAHCNCRESNQEFFKISIKKPGGDGRVYHEVPVTPDNDVCRYCGHRVFYKVRQTSIKNMTKNKQGILGVNASTGVEVRFDSEDAAERAGHKGVRYSLTLKHISPDGWNWIRLT